MLLRGRCKKCKGERTLPDKKRVEFELERGLHFGERIVVKGEGDESVSPRVSPRTVSPNPVTFVVRHCASRKRAAEESALLMHLPPAYFPRTA